MYNSGGENGNFFIVSNGVTSIGDSAFCGCDNLTSIVILDSVTLIECRAFSILQNATFENTSGWTVVSSNGTANAINSDELADTATAGEYLTYIYIGIILGREVRNKTQTKSAAVGYHCGAYFVKENFLEKFYKIS